MSLSIVFQSYQDDGGKVTMKGMFKRNIFHRWEKLPAPAALETRTTSSASQRLTYSATGAPHKREEIMVDGWMTCDFTSFSTVFQSYQDEERLRDYVQWKPVNG